MKMLQGGCPGVEMLARYVGSETPGLHYLVVDAEGIRCEYADGLAEIRNQNIARCTSIRGKGLLRW